MTYSPLGPRLRLGRARLAEYRVRDGVTQFELADRTGLGQTTISRIENHVNCRISDLVTYFSGLGYDLQITLTRDDDTPETLPLLDLM